MNVRQGPSTRYAIVGVAEAGETFDIAGRNIAGDWWRIDYEEQKAWIYAPFVTATNADRIRVFPTPALPPTPTPHPPSASAMSSSEKTNILAAALILFDQEALGTKEEWLTNSQSFQNKGIALASNLLTGVALYCDLSIEDAAGLVNKYGTFLDNVGYTARNGLPVRRILMYALQTYADNYPNRQRSCDALFDAGVTKMLEDEGK